MTLMTLMTLVLQINRNLGEGIPFDTFGLFLLVSEIGVISVIGVMPVSPMDLKTSVISVMPSRTT